MDLRRRWAARGHEMSVVVGTASQGRPWLRARGEGWAGALAMVPMVAGLAPFALVLGSAIAEHATPVAGWAGIWPIFSGSAHLIVLQVVDEGGGAALAIASGLLVNARVGVYERVARRSVAGPALLVPSRGRRACSSTRPGPSPRSGRPDQARPPTTAGTTSGPASPSASAGR